MARRDFLNLRSCPVGTFSPLQLTRHLGEHHSRNVRLAIEHPNGSDARSEEENMTTIALSHKAAKLMKLCDIEGFDILDDLLEAAATDTVCPAICMTEGCDYTTEMEPDQDRGFCEVCGGQTVTSALVLAGLI
jgi:hypothetical protein